jgi:hypothetical protein
MMMMCVKQKKIQQNPFKLTFFDGKLCGDFDELVSLCESCDDVDICDVFINDGSE